jgi:GT2 family glycosyltransferase
VTGGPQPDVSLVIPAYNRPDLLRRCLGSLEHSAGITWEATVVDDASPKDLSEVREAFPQVRWLRLERNSGYAAANNAGLEGARGRYVGYLNSDAELLPDTLSGVIRYLDANPDVGAATPRNIGPDGETQPACSPEHGLAMAWLRDSGFHLLFPNAPPFRGWLLPDFEAERVQEVAHTQTTLLVVRADAYQALGGMDPELFLYYNDVDFCRRLRARGWKLVYLPEPRVVHLGGGSTGTAAWRDRQLWRDRYRYYRKWHGALGTAGTRFACGHRLLTRVLAQLPKGRLSRIPEIWREGAALWRALNDGADGA